MKKLFNISFKKQIHFSSDMGRMGNQMFQYACAKELQHHYGFTTSLSHLDKLACFELSICEKSINRIKSFLFFRLWKSIWGLKSINTELKCLQRSYLPELISINCPTTVWGFFQAEEYFVHSKTIIKKHFQIKSKLQAQFKAWLITNKLERGKYIAIHLRRTDYKGFTVPGLQGDDFTLPVRYYQKALKIMDNSQNLPLVFVSDDPSSIPDLFPEMDHKIISDNDAVTDFLILQNAAKLVISNSTFAWWASYLNDFNPFIICPRYFLGFKESIEIPINIYPSNWMQIEV